jgi:hypothetical protein
MLSKLAILLYDIFWKDSSAHVESWQSSEKGENCIRELKFAGLSLVG